MSLFTRAGLYYVRVTGPDGREIKRSTGTRDKRKAQEYHDRLKADLWEQIKLKQKPRRTWDEAALKWLDEKEGKKRTLVRDEAILRWFQKDLSGRYLDEVTRELVDNILSRKLRHVSDRTKDTYVAVIRGIMRRAEREWEWIDKVPTYRIYQGQAEERDRHLTSSEAQTFLRVLPDYLRLPTVFALATGLRKSNVANLRWSQVDLDRRTLTIRGSEVKNKDRLVIPLNAVAMQCLAEARGGHPEYVFTYRNRQLKNPYTKVWRRALQEAGIDDFRFHDLRHTWASWLGQGGVTDIALMRLAGWKTLAMAKRYTHFNVEHLRASAEVCPNFVLSEGTPPSE